MSSTRSPPRDKGRTIPSPPEELDRRGIRRLPTSLCEFTDALAADSVLREALGSALIDSVLAVRESEIEPFTEASVEEVVRALR